MSEFKLVPVDPTPEMLAAWHCAYFDPAPRADGTVDPDVSAYRAMLAAAPTNDELARLRAKLAELAEAGTGYSQQTVDALTRERDKLRDALWEIAKNQPNLSRATRAALEAALGNVREGA